MTTLPWNQTTRPNTGLAPRTLMLMFVPLALVFTAIGLMTFDLKHPLTDTYTCQVLDVGRAAAQYKTPENTLYTASGNPLHDIGLNCARIGVVVVNDFDVFLTPVLQGAPVSLQHKNYRWLPARWQLAIRTPG